MARAIATFAIPCYEAGPHLRPLLESLLAQSRTDFELLLVDDASTDDSVEIARQVAGDRIRIHRNERRLGIGGNWNRCASLVTTPFFCLAHMDDVYEPTFLESLLVALDAHPAAGFAHCRVTAVDAAGSPFDSAVERYKDRFWARGTEPDPARLFALLREGNFVVCPSVVYRRDAFARVGPFDESLRFALDWQHHLRMLLAGFALAAVPQPLVHYRRHARSATSAHVASLDRYREEAVVIRWLEAEGRARGILLGGRPSRALRNNLLHDAWADLCSGRPESAAARLRFARDVEPELGWDLAARTFAALARLGAAGRLAIRAALHLVLWRAKVDWARARGGP
ncbi:MAG: glycosyltransferase [Planctomycetes bacterium]|nr:glycosyltransferase [Planctomycetota bacterium]